jgi:signal transduction histidine kinase/CheY-like chemotaxis protein
MTRIPVSRSRWRYRDLPIQRKISIIIVIGMASAMIVTVANFISFDRENVKRDLGEEMRVLARITAARSAVAVAFGDRSNARENLSALSLRSTIQYACIYDEQQRLFAHFQRREDAQLACPTQLDHTDEQGYSGGGQLLVVVEPIFRKGLRLGYVLVASDLSPIAERTRKWIVTSAFVTLAALLVAFLMTRRMQRSVVQPIIDLAQVMDRVRGSNNLSLRARARSQDEVGSLVESFNEMLEIVEINNRDLELLYRGLVEKSAEAEATAASLELRNQQIRDLFGSAAHDLRQPLQAMSIFAQTLSKKVQDPEHLQIVDKLRQAIQNLSGLFKEILDVSRYEFDLSVAGTQPVSIKQLLGKVFLEFEALAEEKGLKLRFHTRDYRVLAHGALLERIIRNLLSNAIRYTDQGGVLLGCRRRGKRLVIEVWDTGRGIPAQKQQQIFNRYVQVSDDDREERGGFGLGLAIVKQFVDSLGYKLTLASRVGRGTVFRLAVPLVEEAVRIRPEPVRVAPPGAQARVTDITLERLQDQEATRILLIDDNADVRGALKLTLNEWGFAVDDFAEVPAMLDFYRSGGRMPALIISDYELGEDMTGDRAISQARLCLQREVPAFIVTGAEDPRIWQAVQASGFTALRKPVRPARLRALINHLLR